jgi:hypothetical protein
MPTWTTPLDFPKNVRITNVSITPEDAVGIRESPSSYHQEVQVFGGQRLKMQVDFKEEDPEQGSRLEAFFLKLRGSAGTFRFFDPYHTEPMGQAMGLPTVSVAVKGEQTITTTGWLANVNYQLRQGDYIQITDDLHRVLDDVHSDASGNATLTLWPDLRASHSASAAIIIRNPVGLWRLSRAPTYTRSASNQKHAISMECVEAR